MPVPTRLSPVVRLLSELVAIPSVNPAFLPKDDPRTGEAAVAKLLGDLATRGGLDVTFQDILPQRRNVIARLSPPGIARRRILLAPHLDTVGEPRLDGQLRPGISRGRLWGRGACDTKGCVAAMFSALLSVAASGARPRETELVFLGLVDEENGQGGSRGYARMARQKEFRADLAVVGEPTRLEVVTAHKGDLWLQLRAVGIAAHGATPHLGKSAVHLMARVVDVLETKYRAQIARKSHPLLGAPTVNVGSIRGGTQPNIVPAECVISIDRRTLPGETEMGVKQEIQKLLRSAGLRVEFDNLRSAPCEALETDPALPGVQALLVAAGKTKSQGVHYFCDAAPLSAGGIPAVVFGPGDIAQAHTSEEWINISELEQGTAILEKFLRSQA